LINIDNDKCIKCGACAAVCPNVIIEEIEGRMEVVHKYSCMKCYHCIAVCPEDAVTCDELPLERFKTLKGLEKATADGVETLLMSRRSIREFKNKPVSRGFLEKLIEIAGNAPTGHNAQAVELSVITDRGLIDKLDKRIQKRLAGWISITGSPVVEGAIKLFAGSKTADSMAVSRTDFKRYHDAEGAGRLHVFRGAPVLIVAHSGFDAMTGKDDCVIALSHAMFAAEAHGLGATWIGYLVGVAKFDAKLKKPLGVPASNTIHAAMILGWPKYKYERMIPRKPVSVKWIG
jgi:nitroreductase/NAD-dependent dihydropyrimidine dehydrogenase PreA subunit